MQRIKEVAARLVRENGLINLTRENLAEACGIPAGSFPHHMGMSFTEFITTLQGDATLMAQQPIGVLVGRGRTTPELRYPHILHVALELARQTGYANLTRVAVAEAAGVSEALISHYFGAMPGLRQTILEEGVKRGIVEIVAQGLANGSPQAREASEDVKQAAINWMA